MPLFLPLSAPRIAASSLVLAALALVAGPVAAQSPTPEQLRMLQELSPEERDAALDLLMDRKLGGAADQPLEEGELVRPREVGATLDDDGEELDSELEEIDEPEDEIELKPFGYDLFAGEPSTFAPATDIPIPVDYIVGPGDTVQVQLFGQQNADYRLVVSREGMLNFPELGPVSVAGLRFQQMKDDIEKRVADQMIGVRASITMGPLRSIRVFVLGDAYRPGSYTVSALSTITNALFVSGGVKEIGSLRNIQLKRSGRLIKRLDLYDLLLKGDTRADARLLPGDVIFIAPAGDRVGVSGEVRRPAIYELRGEKTLGDVLNLAGGLLPTADPAAANLERIDKNRQRTVVDVNLASQSGLNFKVRPGDMLHARPVLEQRENIVTLRGHVYREGDYQWRRGMRLTDLIPSADALMPKADLRYVMIRRELAPDKSIEVLSADISANLSEQRSGVMNAASNPVLQPRDEVFVFDLSEMRRDLLDPVLEDLRSQATPESPAQIIGATGRVKAPGTYPLEPGMRLRDAIRAAGGLQESAYTLEAELTRYEVVSGDTRITEHRNIDLQAALGGDPQANVVLQPHDYLNFKEVPQWRDRQVVTIEGEVNFPGEYSLMAGETMSSVLARAGGITEIAFPDGAIFERENIRERERQQLESLAKKLEGDLAGAALKGAQSTEGADFAGALALGKELVEQLRSTEPSGRLVIDLQGVLAGNPDADIALRDGDVLTIPRKAQEVTIVGEVQNPTSHLYDSGLSRKEYISRSGGYTSQADQRRVYVVRANGSVVTHEGGSLWFRRGSAKGIRPGDTIVVPLDADRVSTLTKLSSISQILYQLGLAAASAKTVGVF